MMDKQSIRDILENSILCGLSDTDLSDLLSRSRQWKAGPGVCLISTGDVGDTLLVLLEGELEVVRESEDGDTALARLGPGAFVGEMSLIDDSPRSATVRALTDVEILEISRSQFDELLEQSPDACRTLIRTVLRRLRSTEAMLVNQEKLAALGRVAAGLAHELNNPASAMSRFVVQLEAALGGWKSELTQFPSGVTFDTISPVLDGVRLETERDTPEALTSRSALQRSVLEDQISDWIADRGVEQPWLFAAQLADAGIAVEKLESIESEVGHESLGPTVKLLALDLEIQSTLAGLRESAERVSEIVSSVKRYAHMDRAAVERVDINQGLESTLLILKHKLRDVEVTREFQPDLPEIVGFPAELNQVWTNLIDNAIDAMSGVGQLLVKSSVEGDYVVVEIVDSGSGIPEDSRSRLFEPFFTTKDIGAGTGLGLHIAHTIVVHRHRGRIDVNSVPGRTEFRVSIPIGRERTGD